MRFIKKNWDYVIVGVLMLLLGFIPLYKFIVNYLHYVNDLGYEKMLLFEFWNYSLWDSGMYMLLLSPIVIILFTTYRFFRVVNQESMIIDEYNGKKFKQLKRLVLNSWIKSSLLLLFYSLIIFVIGFLLPTRGDYLQDENMFNGEPVKLFIFTNINLVLFSLFVTNIGLIVVRFVNKYYLVVLFSLFGFVSVTMGLIAIGAGIENAIDSNFNSDWMWIYNSFAFDSGLPFGFATGMLTLLFTILTVVLYLVYKGNKELEE